MTILGTAEVLIIPSTAGFEAAVRKETEAGMSGFRKDAETAGTDAGVALRGGVTKETGKLSGDLEKHGNAAGSALSSGVGKGLLVVGAAAAGAAVEAVHLGESMQSADAAIAAASGTSVKSAAKIGDAFLDTAGKSEFSAQTQAKAFASVAGQLEATEGHALNAAQATQVMSAAGDLATAKQIDLGTATQATAGIMQAFHLSTKDAADVTDALYVGSTKTGQGVDTLASSIERVRARLGPTAGSVQDLTGLLVDMTNQGVTGRSAMSGLNTAVSSLIKPTTQGAQAAKTLGLETFNSSGKFVGLQSIITQLAPKFAGMTQQQQLQASTMIFGAGAARQMLAVINAGPSAYANATAAVSKHGSAQQAAAKQTSDLHGQEKVLGAEVSDLATRLGSVLIPVITAFTAGIIHASTYVMEHKTLLIGLAAVVTGVLGAAIAVFTVNKMAAFGNSFVTASGHVKSFVGDVQTGVNKVIGLFGKQSEAADAMSTKVGSATTAASTAVESEATATTSATGTIEADNTRAGTSFAAVGTEAQAAEVKVGAAEATMVTEVTAADTTIETENAAAAASFAEIGLGAGGVIAGGLVGKGDQLTNPQAIYNFAIQSGSTPAQALANVRKIDPNFKPGQASSSGGASGGSSGSVGAQGIPPAIANTNFTPSSFAVATMESLGIKPTAANVRDFTAWENQEGGNWKNSAKFNPLNTTMGEPGAGNTGSQGNIKVYQSWAQGLQATVATLKNYPGILAALSSGASPSAFSAAVANSPWGTGSVSAAGNSLTPAQVNALANLVSGGTTSGSASTRSASAKGGFKADPGTQQTEGQLPTLTARLNALGKSLGDTIYGISGYRTPAHSVAVGGFANDPHTKGIAEDIGVNSQLRSSATQLSNAQLAQFGLERTFDKSGTNPNEVNHIQLIPGWTGKLPAGAGAGVSAANPALGGSLSMQPEATKAQMAAAKQEAADTKTGIQSLNGLLKDVHSTNLKQLTSDLNKTHNAQLGDLAKKLENDGSAQNEKLANELIKVHSKAMDQWAKESLAAQKKAEQAAEVTKLDQQSKIIADQAKKQSDQISDQTKIYLDKQAESTATGVALTAAQAQTSLDQVTAANNQAIDAAQTKVDQSSNGSALVQAQAAEALAQAQATASVQEAQAQSVLDKATAAANAAAAATTTSDTTATPAAAAAPVNPTYNFQIFGNGTLTSSDLFREVGWALTTGALPVAAPAVGVPTAAA